MSTRQKSATIHPDENRLAAFVERALRGADRQAVVAHLADCARCREIVFLAREAGADREPAQGKVAHPIFAPRRWQIATAAAVGVALFGAALLVWQGRRLYVPSGYHKSAEAVAPRDKSPSPPTSAAKAPVIETGSIPEKSRTAIRTDLRASSQQKGAVSKQAPSREFALRSRFAPSSSSGHSAGSNAANSDAGALPVQTRPVLSLKSAPLVSEATPATVQPELSSAPRSTAESVTVMAGANTGAGELGSQAVSPPADLMGLQKFASHFTVVKGKLRRWDASGVQVLRLPNGTRAKAVASGANVVLLLSRSRNVYRSTDLGDHWTEVPAQWQGKAANLDTELTVPAQPSAAIQSFSVAGAGAAGGVAPQAPPPASTTTTEANGPAAGPAAKPPSSAPRLASTNVTFVLTNSAGKRWISRDGGQTWLPE